MKKSIQFAIALFSITLLFSSCNNNTSTTKNTEMAEIEIDSATQFLNQTGISVLNYVQVSESVVMVHNDKLQGSNITCVALDDGLVFFDCSFFTEIGAEFRRAMEEKYQRKTIALVQSHAHTDHFFGMDAFNDVPYIASLKEKQLFERQIKLDFEKYKIGYMTFFPLFDKALESAKFRTPTIWFDGEYVLGSGDSKLILSDAGGHTEGSAYAYFEKEKVILVGDDIQVDYYPYFGDQSGSLIDWMNILVKWEEMEIDYVCAGHGPVTDKMYITKTRGFVEDLVMTLYDLKEKNTPIKEMLEVVNSLEKYWPAELKKPGWYDDAILSVYGKI